ncbi:MAG: S-methyl-5-thioribose-1-phosphate isomerase [Pseudanabaenales cyanobacterium]|nr:S-methyl-5-thioribose-1-phosphate isomerase [Pseudanabaenales cyanobacterium]
MYIAAENQVYPVIWQDDHVVLIDQNQLPHRYTVVTIHRCEDMVTAINTLIVRGAPAIGVAAAYGMYLGAEEILTEDRTTFLNELEKVAEKLRQTRPSKANLAWAIDRMLKTVRQTASSVSHLKKVLLETAQTLHAEDIQTCRAIGDNGLTILPTEPTQLTIFTHCNHGALATAGYGTSLGVVRSAWREGRLARIYVGETRPRLQGSRLTAWECVQEGIPVTVVTDSMAAHCMQQGLIHAVLVGADRIAANGDTATKIGAYSLALVAKAHKVPFLVAAPLSTVDFSLTDGGQIPIEQHPPSEIYQIGETITSPAEAEFYNPAFDITPADLITAIITEHGAIKPGELHQLEARKVV